MTAHPDAAIRLARPDESALVTSCVRAAYAQYLEQTGREPAPMSADYADLIAHGSVYVLQAQSVERIHGVLVLRTDDRVLWIENVAVQPEHQRRGYGRRLLRFTEQQARAAGLSEVWLYTNELMVENIRLYARLGYLEVDRRLDDGFRRVFMRKHLQTP